MESTVKASGLDWVIVRPASLKDRSSGGTVRVFNRGEKARSITRSGLATCLVDELAVDHHLTEVVTLADT